MRQSTRFILLIAVALISMVVHAQTVTIDQIKYTISGSQATVSGSESSIVTANIPSSITYDGANFPVTAIGNQAFCDRYSLKSASIPNSVSTIGNEVFGLCTSLEKVTLPSTLTTIPYRMFRSCSKLTDISIPATVKTIGDFAFDGCRELASLTLPNSLQSIGTFAFNYCVALTELSIPNSVTSLGESCFFNAGITSIELPATITTIPNGLFRGCKNLSSVTLPASITSIGENAFYECQSLTAIEIPSTVSSIGKRAFGQCRSLTTIAVPNLVTTLSDETFIYCSKLSSVTLPDGLTTIGGNIFNSCTSLTQIEIPSSVTSIGVNAFTSSGLTSIVIPNSVKNLGTWTFNGCKQLESITLPDAITTLGEYTFYNCTALTSIVIPNSVTKIGAYAFSGCTALSSMTLPVNLGSIGSKAFENVAALTSVTYDTTAPMTADANLFEQAVYNNAVLHMPQLTIRQINQYTPWKQFVHKDALPVEVDAVELNETSLSIIIGKTARIVAVLTPEDATDKTITFTSSDQTVATVAADGTVTAVGLGEATIRVQSSNPKVYAECKVTVLPIEVNGVTLNITNTSVEMGTPINLTATITPSDATFKELTWTSSNETVATVSPEGVVTTLAVGEATIRVQTSNPKVYGECKVTVKPISVKGLTLSDTEMSVYIGSTATITATITPDNAADKTLVWTSSDESIVKVSAEGVITAVNLGKAIIHVQTSNPDVSADCQVTVLPIEVEGIKLSDTAVSILIGSTHTLSATISPENATFKQLTWTSSDETIATVSEDGVITAVNVGEATIHVQTSNPEVSADCKVTVLPIEVAGIKLSDTEVSILIGSTHTLTAELSPENATYKELTWTSSDETIATVSEDGLITAVNVGEATIHVQTSNPAVSADCKVTVLPIEVSGIKLSDTEVSILLGSTHTLTAELSPENATYKELTWTSSDESVATVSEEGVITAVGLGEATIHVQTSNPAVSADCKVTVLPIEVDGIKLSDTEVSILIGSTHTLTAELSPENATFKELTWTSSDETIATVSEDGVITAVNVGEATIHVQTSNPEVSADCKVTVLPILVESITISPDDITLYVDEEVTLTATVAPENATFKAVEWSSSDDEIATVDEEGNVKAIKGGNVTITATATDGSGVSASVKIFVKEIIEAISINPESLTITEGDIFQLELVTVPATEQEVEVEWTSEDPSIVYVDANGLITAVKEGVAKVTATVIGYKDEVLTAETTITVEKNMGINDATGANAEISVKDMTVTVKNISAETPVEIFTTDGSLVTIHCGECSVELPSAGFYIIRVSNITRKVAVK